jgi:hypothetical protein
MNILQHVLPGVVVALAVVLPAGADEPQLAHLSWLAGCWHAVDGEPGTIEQWTPLAGGSLLGVSRTVAAGRTVMYEFMRIAPDAAGDIARAHRGLGGRQDPPHRLSIRARQL